MSKSRHKLKIDVLGPYFTPQLGHKSHRFFIPIIQILEVDTLKLLKIYIILIRKRGVDYLNFWFSAHSLCSTFFGRQLFLQNRSIIAGVA